MTKKKELEKKLAKARKKLKAVLKTRGYKMRNDKPHTKEDKREEALLNEINDLNKQIEDLGIVHPLRF